MTLLAVQGALALLLTLVGGIWLASALERLMTSHNSLLQDHRNLEIGRSRDSVHLREQDERILKRLDALEREVGEVQERLPPAAEPTDRQGELESLLAAVVAHEDALKRLRALDRDDRAGPSTFGAVADTHDEIVAIVKRLQKEPS